MSAISTKEVCFSYEKVEVLHKISIDIKEGDFVALIGRNGSGKTTLLKLILGLLEPRCGKIEILGKDSKDFSDWEKIGYVPQKTSIDKNFPATVEELLSLRENKLKEASKILKIDPLRKKKFNELSGGQQQKVLIAISLLSNPKLILLDEPTVGVDIKAQHDFYTMLKRLNSELGMTIILVTHDVGLISSYVKNVICLNGDMSCQGPVKQTEKLLTKVYGKDFFIHRHD